MDIETATRTILDKNPGIKSKELLRQVKKLTGKGRSAIFEKWQSLYLQSKLYREKGRYWNKKPREPQRVTGFWSFLSDWKTKRQEERNRKLMLLECELDTIFERIELEWSGELAPDDPEYFRKLNKIKLKKLKEYGLVS